METRRQVRKFKDVMGDQKLHFHEDLPRVAASEMIGQAFVIKGVQLVKDWESSFGTSSFYLVWCEDLMGAKQWTTRLGGVVRKQIAALENKRAFPVEVTLTQYAGAETGYPYYQLE